MNKKEILKEFKNSGDYFGIFLFDNFKDEESFLNLFYDCFGKRTALDKDWYYWFYENNPYGKCNNYGLINLKSNELTGAFGYSKIGYEDRNMFYTGRLAVNGMVNKKYTGRGLYSYLIYESSELELEKNDFLFSFPHGNNVPSFKGHINAGWKILSKNYFYSKKYFRNIKADDVKICENIDELKYFDFSSFYRDDGFRFFRNYDWLKWRYLSRPNKKYFYLISYSGSQVMGYMILGSYISAKEKRCQIVDYRVCKTNSLDNLILASENIACKNNFNKLDIMLNGESVDTDLFLQNNFIREDNYYDLLIYSKIKTNLKINSLLGDFDVV